MQPLNILLVQLGANGDCLFVTTIAKQIKEVDYPGCNLTWMIGTKFLQVIRNNPFIDDVIEIPVVNVAQEIKDLRDSIPLLVEKAQQTKKYDHVFVTDYTPENYSNWFGTIRSSLFRNYPHPLKIDPSPLIFLEEKEVSNVRSFCKSNGIDENHFNVLFECSPQSGQSKMNFETALSVAQSVAGQSDKIKIILSSPNKFTSVYSNVIDGSELTWRENAEIVNHCNLFIGCSSGISWLCTSTWSKKIPFIQIIDPDYMQGKFSASMQTDFRYFGRSTSLLLEMHNPSDQNITESILLASGGEFAKAKQKFDVLDKRSFKNAQFLKESKLSVAQKLGMKIKFQVPAAAERVYRKIKPAWFQPGVWKRKMGL